MKLYLKILLLLWLPCQASATMYPNRINSIGALSFKCNGQLYTADSTHARGYAVKQTTLGYINGANSDNMVIGIEWKGIKGIGTFYISNKEGKAEFTINHKTYYVKEEGDYVKIVISTAREQGAFFLLSGTFEGQLQDKNGNKVKITEGKVQTQSI